MSADWIVLVVFTGLLVIVTAYSIFLTFRGGRDEDAEEPNQERPSDEAASGPERSRKAA